MVHGVKSFQEVTKHPYTPADTANVLDLAHRITREAGRKPVAKNGVKLKAGMDTFIWRAKPNHPRPSKAFESTPYTGFGLRLMSSLNDVSGIPTEGKDLIIVAAVNNVLYFRVFDGDGKVVVDTDEKRLTGQARQIEDLRKQLESLWPPHELTWSDKDRVITAVTSIVSHTRLELNGLLLSGGPIRIECTVKQLSLVACTLDPRATTWEGSLVTSDMKPNSNVNYQVCRCITGGLRPGKGVASLTVADSIIDQQGGLAIGGLPVSPGPLGSPPAWSPLSPPSGAGPILDQAAGSVQLERVTVLGRIYCEVLSASETLLDEHVVADDQQVGCLRYSRYEPGSQLPRHYQCVPNEAQLAACGGQSRCLAPRFNSRQFGRPDYAQLAAVCPSEILAASEKGSEIGAFTGALGPLRLANLLVKLSEYLPVGLSAVVVAET